MENHPAVWPELSLAFVFVPRVAADPAANLRVFVVQKNRRRDPEAVNDPVAEPGTLQALKPARALDESEGALDLLAVGGDLVLPQGTVPLPVAKLGPVQAVKVQDAGAGDPEPRVQATVRTVRGGIPLLPGRGQTPEQQDQERGEDQLAQQRFHRVEVDLRSAV